MGFGASLEENDRMAKKIKSCIWGFISLARLLDLLHAGFSSSSFLHLSH